MDFSLNDKQKRWRETARAFADTVVRPVSQDLDSRADPADCFDWALIESASAAGLRASPLPAQYGGDETDHLTQVLMLEELSAADMGVAVILAGTWRTMRWLMAAGSQDQLQRWLPRIGGNPRGLMAAALTEEVAGSDNMLPYGGTDGGMRMSAVRSGSGWVLNGTKRYITNANRADVIVAFARTDTGKNIREGVTTFLLAADTPGLSVGTVFNKSGERLANNAELIFRDVHVPDMDRFGDVGQGLSSFVKHQRATSAYNAATVYGVAREALRRALVWTRTRVQGGKPIYQHQAVGAYLVDMLASVDVARTYAWRAAWAADNPAHFSPPLNVFPKVFASEQAMQAVAKCMELFGGASIMRDVGVEKLLRDASVFLHSDGTNMILRQRIADWLGTVDEQQFHTLWTPG